MNALFWFTGLAVWLVIGLYLAGLLAYVGWCFVVAADLLLWARKCARAEGLTWTWWHPASFLLRNGWRFVRTGYRGTSFHRAAGCWDGFRTGQLYVGYERPNA